MRTFGAVETVLSLGVELVVLILDSYLIYALQASDLEGDAWVVVVDCATLV